MPITATAVTKIGENWNLATIFLDFKFIDTFPEQ